MCCHIFMEGLRLDKFYTQSNILNFQNFTQKGKRLLTQDAIGEKPRYGSPNGAMAISQKFLRLNRMKEISFIVKNSQKTILI